MQRTLSRAIVASAILAAPPVVAQAQQATTVTGRVTAAGTETPLSAVQVRIASTNVGGQTREDGTFSFVAPAQLVGTTVTLSARRIGYAAANQQVALKAGANSVTFTLTATAAQLTGVIVSALGERREKSTLGTAQTQLSTEELNTTFDPNLVNQLAGKVSGVQVTGGGTQGGSSQIRIRGVTSLTGNNSPLFIVDGTPVSSETRGGDPAGVGGTSVTDPKGADYGSAIQDINPDDIATLTVLKGPNAAALYGSRAANGVIIITTKRGLIGRSAVQASSNVTWDQPSILPSYQNLYAQGSGGEFDYVDGQGGGVQDGNDQSYGPRMDGRTTGCVFQLDAKGNAIVGQYDMSHPCRQFTAPNGGPLIPHPNNVSSFFNTGRTLNGQAAFTGGTSKAQARVSIGGENVDGIVPNSFLQRVSTLANGTIDITDRLSSDASVSYIRNTGRNRPGTGYNTGIMEQFVWFGRQVDMNALRKMTNPDGSLYNWNYNYHNNPFWLQSANPQTDQRDRVIATGNVRYKLNDWINATLRSGVDNYRFGIDADYAKGNLNFGDLSYNGAFTSLRDTYNEANTDLIVNAAHSLGEHFSFTGLVGGNQRRLTRGEEGVNVNGLSVEGIYNVSNAAIAPANLQNTYRSRINGVYGDATVTYNRWLTLEGTARNDWTSTLPRGANSYFYPSINASVVLTDALPSLKNHVLSFAKLRGGVARVGADANPYSLATTFSGSSSQFAGLPLYSLGNTIANATLKPEQTTSREIGAELGFFDNRVTLDASYYHKFTRDQIIPIVVSQTSGFTTKIINAGELSNHGVEALLSTTPYRSKDLEWNSSFNYSQNKAIVNSLYPGLQTIVLGGTWSATVEARVHEPYGAIRGYTILKDKAGNWLLGDDGLPQRGPLSVLGNVQPKWVGGWNNSVRYKRFMLSALVDMHVGGSIFSVTNMFGEYTGVLANTTLGREADWNNPGIVVKGITESTGKPNTQTVTSEQYFQSFFRLHERYVYDDTWYKLRELRVGFDVPPNLTRRYFAQSTNIALVGRNLLTKTNVPNIDPEFAYTTGNYQGMEFAALPNARSIGFSIRVVP